MLNEFREFALRGSVVDLAVGFILGAALGTIITSLVNDILMPPIGMLLGGVAFSELFIDLSGTGYPTLAAAQEAGAPTINYGLFLTAGFNFLLIALALFVVVKGMNSLQREAEEAEQEDEPPGPDPQEELIAAINRLTQVMER